jgi:hypothetical protein
MSSSLVQLFVVCFSLFSFQDSKRAKISSLTDGVVTALLTGIVEERLLLDEVVDIDDILELDVSIDEEVVVIEDSGSRYDNKSMASTQFSGRSCLHQKTWRG